MVRRNEVSPDEAREAFDYDPETGILTWRADRGIRARKGKVAGCVARWKRSRTPYLVVSMNYRTYFAHRIIFAIMTGRVPQEVDHIDGDGLNNRWSNLRECTKAQNNANMRARVNAASPYKGVTFHKPTKRWRARIVVNKRERALGYYATQEEAAEAYRKAAVAEFGEFARV